MGDFYTALLNVGRQRIIFKELPKGYVCSSVRAVDKKIRYGATLICKNEPLYGISKADNSVKYPMFLGLLIDQSNWMYKYSTTIRFSIDEKDKPRVYPPDYDYGYKPGEDIKYDGQGNIIDKNFCGLLSTEQTIIRFQYMDLTSVKIYFSHRRYYKDGTYDSVFITDLGGYYGDIIGRFLVIYVTRAEYDRHVTDKTYFVFDPMCQVFSNMEIYGVVKNTPSIKNTMYIYEVARIPPVTGLEYVEPKVYTLKTKYRLWRTPGQHRPVQAVSGNTHKAVSVPKVVTPVQKVVPPKVVPKVIPPKVVPPKVVPPKVVPPKVVPPKAAPVLEWASVMEKEFPVVSKEPSKEPNKWALPVSKEKIIETQELEINKLKSIVADLTTKVQNVENKVSDPMDILSALFKDSIKELLSAKMNIPNTELCSIPTQVSEPIPTQISEPTPTQEVVEDIEDKLTIQTDVVTDTEEPEKEEPKQKDSDWTLAGSKRRNKKVRN